jgi:ankyrin repeat protein
VLDAPGALPIATAAYVGNAEVVRALIAAGARPDGDTDAAAYHESPLAIASEAGRIEALDALVAGGANVNGVANDGLGFPPIAVAADREHEECIRHLVAAHAQIDRRDLLGMTALANATLNGNVGIVRMLLAAGASPMAANRAGATPASIASDHGRLDLVAIFRGAGVTDFLLQPPPPLPPSGYSATIRPAF